MNVGTGPDQARFAEQLSTKLAPAQIRMTLMHSSLMQLIHEFIKQWVVNDVKGLYGFSDLAGRPEWISETSKSRYEADVLMLSPGKQFEASALWLEGSGAISSSQRIRLDEIYAYRHEVAHEIAAFLVDVDRVPDASMILDALDIARRLDRFWISMEKDIGSFDGHGDVDVDQVHSGRTLVLQLCVDAYLSPELNGTLHF